MLSYYPVTTDPGHPPASGRTGHDQTDHHCDISTFVLELVKVVGVDDDISSIVEIANELERVK